MTWTSYCGACGTMVGPWRSRLFLNVAKFKHDLFYHKRRWLRAQLTWKKDVQS